MADLTSKQRSILDYIQNYVKEQGFPPTLRDICKKFSIKSTNGARYHLHRLRNLGYLEIDEGKSRGVRMINSVQQETSSLPAFQKRSYMLPILGRIPAGPFNLASEDLREDELTVDPHFFGSRTESPELFGLRVQGDSMIDAGIFEGDVVVVRAQNNANNGDIVVARFEEGATVKRYRQGTHEVVREPADDRYEPIHIPNRGGSDFGQDFALMGVVVGLIRSI